jgi:DNA-binding MarR family transcriptional regulator
MPGCYCIDLRKAARRVSLIYDEALSPAGINLAQFGLLRSIEHRAPVSLTELGRLTELDRSTVGRNVRVLERMALVEYVPAEDQRESTVILTRFGRRTLDAGAPLWAKAQKKIEAALGEDGATALRLLLASL